jgi:hypothetical protein
MCLQEKAGFVLPYVILDLIGIVIGAVIVVVFSIMAFISSFLVGFVILIVGGLLIGKNCTCIHTYIHTLI